MKYLTIAAAVLLAIIAVTGNATIETKSHNKITPKYNNKTTDRQQLAQLSEKDQRGLDLMEHLIEAGFSAVIASGFVGNASQESDCKSYIASRSGIGAFQHCGYRARGLKRLAKLHNTTWKDPRIQAKWAFHESTVGTEKEDCAPIFKANSPREAALKVSRHYERPKKSRANNSFRASEADRFYKLWKLIYKLR